MQGVLTQITTPVCEPVTLDEAKRHLYIEHEFDDVYITGLIAAARETVEHLTHRQFVKSQWELRLDRFPFGSNEVPPILIYRCPVLSVDSVQYYDVDGTLQTLDEDIYDADVTSTPARLRPSPWFWWPFTGYWQNSVLITFTAGYVDTDDPDEARRGIPQRARAAILFLVAHWYENREVVGDKSSAPASIPRNFDSLIRQLRVI